MNQQRKNNLPWEMREGNYEFVVMCCSLVFIGILIIIALIIRDLGRALGWW